MTNKKLIKIELLLVFYIMRYVIYNFKYMQENIYSWEFDDKRNRWTLWYTIALSIVIWLSVWWFLTKQYWMSFIVLLIAWLVYFVENNSEDIIKVQISELGIKIDKTFYDFTSIQSFWIVYKWEEASLLRLNLNKRWLRNIDLKITGKIAKDLKDILIDYIKEVAKIELSMSEKIINLLKL